MYLFPILGGLFRPLPPDDLVFSHRFIELLVSFARWDFYTTVLENMGRDEKETLTLDNDFRSRSKLDRPHYTIIELRGMHLLSSIKKISMKIGC
jgi:hypothetical protein